MWTLGSKLSAACNHRTQDTNFGRSQGCKTPSSILRHLAYIILSAGLSSAAMQVISVLWVGRCLSFCASLLGGVLPTAFAPENSRLNRERHVSSYSRWPMSRLWHNSILGLCSVWPCQPKFPCTHQCSFRLVCFTARLSPIWRLVLLVFLQRARA